MARTEVSLATYFLPGVYSIFSEMCNYLPSLPARSDEGLIFELSSALEVIAQQIRSHNVLCLEIHSGRPPQDRKQQKQS